MLMADGDGCATCVHWLVKGLGRAPLEFMQRKHTCPQLSTEATGRCQARRAHG